MNPFSKPRRTSGLVTSLAALAISTLAWFAPTGRAQVTVYTDEASFNAATANLNFLLETYEGIAPAGGNGYPAALVAPGADIFSPFSVSNADVYTTSTPQYLEVDDAAFNKISLNGSASLTRIGKFGAQGVGTSAVTMTTDNSATMAFGTEFGLRDPFGPGGYAGGYGGPATYPLTDTVDVQLYFYNYRDLSTTPVGGVFHAGSLANGYLGFVSTQPFNRVTYTVTQSMNYYDDNGYIIADPYQMTWDNSRFGSPPLAPSALYVSDSAAGEIYGYSNAGAQSQFTDSLVNPTALAFDAAGNLYEGDSGSGMIYKATTTGSQNVFASGFGQIAGLAFDASGNLFVASVDANNVGSIIEVTAAGVQSPFATGLTRVQGLAFDASGTLYEAELDTGSVNKFTPAGVESLFASGFTKPTGLAFDATGNLFVCSQGTGVFKVTPAGSVSTFTTNVTDPRYLAFDPDGSLYVTDVGDGTGGMGQGNIYLYTPSADRTTFATGLIFPLGIALNPVAPTATHPSFFSAEVALGEGVYYLQFPNGNLFGYYEFLSDPHYLYHFDLGFEYVFDAMDGDGGVYFYDFTSSDYFYTSPVFPFPYLYDFGLNAFLYYYPDPNNPGHYDTDGVRYFYDFATGKIISK